MAKRIQLRRGTTAQHSSFTGAIGELTMDTDKKILKLHDGTTVGGVNFVEVDATPTDGSNNPVSSNGVFDALVGKVGTTGNETIAGIKTFSSSPILPTPTAANQAISMGNIVEKTGAGLGYGTGSGGTVTQLTSKSTAVTLNKPCGQITMNNAALAAGASVSFTLNTSLIAGDSDAIVLSGKTYADKYRIEAGSIGTANVTIRVTNITAGSLSEALVINFAIIKGSIN